MPARCAPIKEENCQKQIGINIKVNFSRGGKGQPNSHVNGEQSLWSIFPFSPYHEVNILVDRFRLLRLKIEVKIHLFIRKFIVFWTSITQGDIKFLQSLGERCNQISCNIDEYLSTRPKRRNERLQHSRHAAAYVDIKWGNRAKLTFNKSMRLFTTFTEYIWRRQGHIFLNKKNVRCVVSVLRYERF